MRDSWLGRPAVRRRVTRSFYDEAHDFYTPHPERDEVYKAMILRSAITYMQRIYLSGTQPPYLHSFFCGLVHMEKLRTIRASTDRPELSHQLVLMKHNVGLTETFERTLSFVDRLKSLLADDERAIIFFQDTETAESFAERSKCVIYHSKLPAHNPKEQNLWEWEVGMKKVIAATTALAQGIDMPNVKFVVIYENTYGLITYGQQAGRAGRNRKPAYVFVVRDDNMIQVSGRRYHDPVDYYAMTPWIDFVNNRGECRRMLLSRTMDDPSSERTCNDDPTCNPCDICNPEGEMASFVREAVWKPDLGTITGKSIRPPLHPVPAPSGLSAPANSLSNKSGPAPPPQPSPVASTSRITPSHPPLPSAVSHSPLVVPSSDSFGFESIECTPILARTLDKICSSHMKSVSYSFLCLCSKFNKVCYAGAEERRQHRERVREREGETERLGLAS